ncbi:MAG: hypothetical protein GEU73_05975 [Chloroflexi bacterium]|nr:hypothetical protein [Chloroflexota bacterium]
MTPGLAWELEEARNWVRLNKDREPWRYGRGAMEHLRRLLAEIDEDVRQPALFEPSFPPDADRAEERSS